MEQTQSTLPALVVIGATSEIGTELGLKLCTGRPVILLARRQDEQISARYQQAGATSVTWQHFDALELTRIRELVANLPAFDTAIVSFGLLGNPAECHHHADAAVELVTVDYTAQIAWLTTLKEHLLDTGKPATLIAFSSIAGWRARKANYVYGSTKAGLDAYCSGLQDELHGSNVRLILARPGFVIGNMTAGMKPAPMSSTAPQVAAGIMAELDRQQRKNHHHSATLWLPKRLVWLARIARIVPRPIWRKMPR